MKVARSPCSELRPKTLFSVLEYNTAAYMSSLRIQKYGMHTFKLVSTIDIETLVKPQNGDGP